MKTKELVDQLLNEREEIKNKYNKLCIFLEKHAENELNDIQLRQMHLLSMQSSTLFLYISILSERIANLLSGGLIEEVNDGNR